MNQAAAAHTVATSIALPGVPRIGAYWEGQGGLNAGIVRGENGASDYFLILSTDDRAATSAIAYGSYGKKTTGANSKLDGLANTVALVSSENDHPAAQWARSLEIDGFSDFYLPSIGELAQLYASLPGLFKTDDWYWSSTQFSAYYAWVQGFSGGGQSYATKNLGARGVAVRRLVIRPFSTSIISPLVAA